MAYCPHPGKKCHARNVAKALETKDKALVFRTTMDASKILGTFGNLTARK